MRTGSQLLLTFLLNAVWEIALIAALARFGAWLLRHAATRYQHWLWVAALGLSLVVPAVTALRTLPDTLATPDHISYSRELNNPLSIPKIPFPLDQTLATTSTSSLQLNNEVAFGLFAAFAVLVLFRGVRLAQAYHSTRRIRRSAVELEGDEAVGAIMRECAKRFDLRADRVTVCRSESVAVPVTIGLFRPVIILPLPRLARINMDQAIQIATSQTPGKVLECSLNGERWEEPGKLAKDGYVFYHVVIADETTLGAATHVWVNAVDGSIIKTEKELPRRRKPENN
jgi:beta-lactamase regulating signal transducer with metallopeptidase domain